jgi:hypothetical protein
MLTFLCHYHLGDVNETEMKFQDIRKYRTGNSGDFEMSCQVLGICAEIIEKYDEAYQSYVRAYKVVPTSDGAGEKEYLYMFFEVAICLYLCSPLVRVSLLFKYVFGSIVTWLLMFLYSMVTLFLALR